MADNKKSEELKIEEKVKEIAATPGLDIAAAIAAGMKMAMESVQRQNDEKKAVVPAPPRAHRLCHECGQAVKGCEGKHVKMVVYPTRYPEFARFFAGVTLNGKNYVSNDENHSVLVPANCVPGFTRIIQEFEDNERQMLIGRKGGGRRAMSGSTGIIRETTPTQAFR
jgi:hypothetical protein